MAPTARRRLLATLVPVAALASLLGACSSAGSDAPAPPPATVTVTQTTEAGASGDAAGDTATDELAALNGYVNSHLPAGHPAKNLLADDPHLNAGFAEVCSLVDGTPPAPAARAAFAKSIAHDMDVTLDDGGVLFDTIVEGCYATGVVERPWTFRAKDYQYGDVLAVLHAAGFDDFIQYAEDPSGAVRDTCTSLDKDEPGGYGHRSEASSWRHVLTDTGDDGYGYAPTRADRFIRTVFAACYSTGRSRAYVPPVPTFGNGTWRVGADVPPGSYRVASARDYCLWYRLNKMTSGLDPDAIIEWGWANAGEPVLATIAPGDVAFQSIGCGTWRKVG